MRCVVALLLAAGTVAHQQVIFRSSTTRVTVDVVVTDRSGQSVTGLQRDDFVLRDRQRPQTILDFDYIHVPLGTRAVDLRDSAAPPIDVADNAKPSPGSRAFVFVIDDGTLGAPSIPIIKRAMAEFLGGMSPDDRAAVLFIRRSDYAQDFTNDPARLIAAVNRTRWALGWGADVRASFLVLQNALRILQSAPQSRKALVYISAGFDISLSPETRDALLGLRPALGLIRARDNAGRLADFAREAGQLGVPLYTFDPTFGVGIRTNDTKGDFLRMLSTVTGGLAFIRPSDLSKAARAIIADNGSYYLLGFSPEPDTPDGKFHSIDVTLPRHPEFRVRARQGYKAVPPVTPLSPAEHVIEALAFAHPGGDLPLRAFAVPVALTERGAKVAVAIEATYPEGAGQNDGEDSLRMVLLAIHPDGQKVGESHRALRVPLAGRHPPFVVAIDDLLDVPRGKGSIRASLVSEKTGRTGVVHIPIDVPAVGQRDAMLAPLVIGLTMNDLPIAQADLIRPFIPFQPTTRRVFSGGDELLVLTRVFGSGTGTTRRLVVKQDGRPIREIAPDKADDRFDEVYKVNLSGLSSGRYVLECILTTRAAKRTFTSAMAFEVR